MKRAVVIGSGPAGLMAAEELARSGLHVTLCEAKPSVGRKFLMAGKSGLNLTRVEPRATFNRAFAEAEGALSPMLAEMDAQGVQAWAEGLGEVLFTGSTGRVFPTVMKASPLLRAWLGRLRSHGVQINTRWQWVGWDGPGLQFHTPQGPLTLLPDVTVLALGGASWSRLGATGGWTRLLAPRGVALAPFAPANAGITCDWSAHMDKHLGAALKGIALGAGPYVSRGEAVLSRRGLEGGGIYAVSRGVREGHDLIVDLLPDVTLRDVAGRLGRPRGKATLTTHLRKALGLDAAKIALLYEMAAPLPADLSLLAQRVKSLTIRHQGLRPIDEAISTAGGVAWDAVDETLMLRDIPGVYVAGEMLDWEAPTGGYLITACLATGAWAGRHAAARALG